MLKKYFNVFLSITPHNIIGSWDAASHEVYAITEFEVLGQLLGMTFDSEDMNIIKKTIKLEKTE